MSDRSNWERERMRDRGHEGNRESWGRERDDWREDWEREPQYSSAEERNRPWGREGRYGGSEEWNRNRGREGYGGSEGRWNEGRGNEGRWNEGREYQPEFERSRSRLYEGSRGYERRSDYGPGEFTRQFRGGGPEYFGTGQRGYGTTWGGSGYTGFGGGSGILGGLGTYSEQGRHTGRGPKGYQRGDDRIKEDICERLTQHPEIDASEIEIQVKNGDVTLTGTVERRDEKRMAEDVADSVSGVKDVHNQLRTQPQHVLSGQGSQSSQGSTQREKKS